ncbi:MAG: 23S rRNA (uracil(1939)-C(5))-methyltransferase RlmD [Lachnospiraceae bacterium]|nr:23S rRNA (uracil(1939)-C(5))-methyltransferase RlmD [Lachnospiraceae bacterium]
MEKEKRPVPVEKNRETEIFIEDMSDNGEGIGRVEGYTLFIKDAVIGDRVRAVVTKTKKNYGYAHLNEILSESPDRTKPVCPVWKRCGGCQLQSLSYPAQLRFKQKKVREHLIRIGGFSPELIEKVLEPIIGMENPLRYRNKTQCPVQYDNYSYVKSGFYIIRTHEIIGNNDCYLGVKENEKILEIVLDYMREFRVPAYDETTGKGVVRHILIRKGFATGELAVCLITNRKKADRTKEGLPHQVELVNRLRKIPGLVSIALNLNDSRNNVILGPETVTIWGEETISDRLFDLCFEISPASFYQVNSVQTEKLYETILEYAKLKGTEEVWDICCGIGTITLCLARQAGRVHGLEIVPDAIENARKNALLNHIENVDFICAAAEEYLPKEGSALRANLIVLDPPRKGMEEKALEAIVKAAPEKIIYVSCDPATLARDLKYLSENGYELRRVRPVDMFPMTVHVESATLLTCVSDRL